MQMNLTMMLNEKKMLEQRRDYTFGALCEMMVERRRILGIVSDHTYAYGEQYNSRQEAH